MGLLHCADLKSVAHDIYYNYFRGYYWINFFRDDEVIYTTLSKKPNYNAIKYIKISKLMLPKKPLNNEGTFFDRLSKELKEILKKIGEKKQ